MRQIDALLVVLLSGITTFAQTTFKISGSVPDDQGKGVPSANVSLLKSKDSLLLKVAVAVRRGKGWNLNLFTNVYNNHYNGVVDSTPIELQFTSFTGNITNSFTIAQGFNGEISGFYRHCTIEGLTKMEPVFQMSIGLSNQVLQGKGTVRLNIRDPFAWQKFEGVNKYANVDNRFLARPDMRAITATFTLRFGKQTLQQQQHRSGSSQGGREQGKRCRTRIKA